jgi:hypothetical protein
MTTFAHQDRGGLREEVRLEIRRSITCLSRLIAEKRESPQENSQAVGAQIVREEKSPMNHPKISLSLISRAPESNS